jgi:hypothetical protein
MTALIVLMGALQVAALVARVLRKQWQAVLLLAGAALMPLLAWVISLVQKAPPDPAGRKMVLVAAGAFALAVVSLWRPLRLVFWLGWLLNAWLVAVLFYVAFFWHPFA